MKMFKTVVVGMVAVTIMTLVGCSSNPKDAGGYTDEVLNAPAIQKVLSKLDCNGRGLRVTGSSLITGEGSREGWYQLDTNTHASCVKFDGRNLPPSGIQVLQQQVAPQQQQQQQQGGHNHGR